MASLRSRVSALHWAINDLGQVTGYSSNNAAESHGYLWENGNFHPLADMPGGQNWVRPEAITSAGQAIGWSLGGPDNRSYAVTWDTAGNVIDLGASIDGFISFRAQAANDNGLVVGRASTPFVSNPFPHNYEQVFRLENGVATLVPTVHGLQTETNYAYSVNNLGQIAGQYTDGTHGYATLWLGNHITLLTNPLGGEGASAFDINDHREVVGYSWSGNGTVSTAVYWDAAGNPTRLADLVDNLSTWKLEYATGINNSGMIVGYGTDLNGIQRGFVLTPNVPEAGATALLASALMGAGSYRPCRRGLSRRWPAA